MAKLLLGRRDRGDEPYLPSGRIPHRLTSLFPHTNNQSPHSGIRQDAVLPSPPRRTPLTRPPLHSHRNPPLTTLLPSGPAIQPHTPYSHTRGHPRNRHHGLDRHTMHTTTQSTPSTTQTAHDTPPLHMASKEQGSTPSGRGPTHHHQTTPQSHSRSQGTLPKSEGQSPQMETRQSTLHGPGGYVASRHPTSLIPQVVGSPMQTG